VARDGPCLLDLRGPGRNQTGRCDISWFRMSIVVEARGERADSEDEFSRLYALHATDARSTAETARVLSCRPGTVKSLLSRAVAELRRSGVLDD